MTMKHFLLFSFCLAAIMVSAQNEFHLEEEFKIDADGTLYLESEDADVTITATDRSNVYVKIDRVVKVKGVSSENYQKFDFAISERNGNLYLEERSESRINFTVGYMSEDYTIDIEVPRQVSLDLEGEDDDYVIYSAGGEITLEVEDGDAEIKDFKGSGIDFLSEDGNLHLEGGSGYLHVETEDGDIEVEGGDFKDVDVETEDGDVELVTNLYSRGEYVFKTDDGDLELIFPEGGGMIEIHHDDCDIRTSEQYRLVRDSEDKTVVQSGNGDADVKIFIEDGSVRLGS